MERLLNSVAGVRLKRSDDVGIFDSGSLFLEINDSVIVETAGETYLGWVVVTPKQLIYSDLADTVGVVLRKASDEDLVNET